MSAVLDAALGYASRGWPVLPLWWAVDGVCACPKVSACGSPAKHPTTPHGLTEASTDLTVVRGWWERWPLANVAIRTDAVQVLDLDDDTDQTWAALRDIHIGPMVATSRCCHIYFQPVLCAGNKVRLLGLPIDWRGAGGYVVAPPSIHAAGHQYYWVPGYGLDRPLPKTPQWLVDLLVAPTSPPRPPNFMRADVQRTQDKYATTALESELGRLAMAGEGTRNDQLNRSAFSLGQLVGAGRLDAHTVHDALLSVALRIGLGEVEARASIKSGLTNGAKKPRVAS
jgi:hypothetical protein